MSTSVYMPVLTSTPSGASSSLELDNSYGSTSATVAKQPVQDIKPTSTESVSMDYKTETLKPSFEVGESSSSQFAMQHATQALLGDTVTMATTSYTSETTQTDQDTQIFLKPSEVTSKPVASSDTSVVSVVTKSSSTSESVHPSKSILEVKTASKDALNRAGSVTSVTESGSKSSKYEPVVSEMVSATTSQSAGQTVGVSLTQSTSTSLVSGMSVIKAHTSTSDYVATSRDFYSTITPSKTEFSPSVLDNASLKTTPMASLTLTPSVKPITTESGSSTPLFGGGANDILLYVAVPLCGVGLLIFIIICFVCIRRRRAKQKGSPSRHPVPDLWVNTNAEVPLTPIDPRRDIGINGGKSLGGNRSSGCVTYEAVYDFPGELDTHLSLRQGDVVHVHRKEDNGWWRGTVGDKTGWFPNNYVQAVLHDYLDEENEVEPHNELNISSFMVKKRDDINRNSYPTEEEIRSEPIYCKIESKGKRKSEPKLEEKSPYKHPPQVNREDTPIPIDEGTKFVALYAYTAQLKGELTLEKGDILLGKEKDRNGWMHGVKESTGQEGWFPAVYVDEIPEIEEKPSAADDEMKTHTEPDPAAYQPLEINTKLDSDKDWVGILHKATHTFTGEKAGDLCFNEGDTVTVFQVLENGWWLGSKDDIVGWFPGSYVEMVGHQSPRPKENEPSIAETSAESEPPTVNKEKPNPGKLRPIRKAPAPPDSSISPSSESKIPKIALPKRKAPPPPVVPVKETEKETSDLEHDPLYDVIGKKPEAGISNDTEQKDDNKTEIKTKSGIPVMSKGEPKVRMRYIKPKVVSVPRNSVNLTDFHFEKEHAQKHLTRPKAPPPPRPGPPKLTSNEKMIPEKFNLPQNNFKPSVAGTDNMDHKLSDNEEPESVFNISTPRKFDSEFKRQDSGNVDDEQPYKTFSSFGSTFGKRDTITPPKEGVGKSQANTKMTGIPKLTRQAQVDSELSPTKNDDIEKSEEKDNMVLEKDKKSEVSCQQKTDKIDDSQNDDSLVKDFDIIQTPDRNENSKSDLNESSSFLEIDTPDSEKRNESDTKVVTPISKIPRLPGSDNVTRIPMSPSAKQKSDTHEVKPGVPDESSDVITPKLESKIEIKDTEDGLDKGREVENTSDQDESNKPVNGDIGQTERQRTNSMDKPPVAPKPKPSGLPKVLPKPKSVTPEKKEPEKLHDGSPVSETAVKDPSPETVESLQKPQDQPKVSKIPQGSKIAQKSPGQKGKTSKIPPSPKVGRKNVESKENNEPLNEVNNEPGTQGISETTLEAVNLKHKPESPHGARKIPRHRTFSTENPSLRNRSNSPIGRTGIPSPSVRNRSNSPAPKTSKPSGLPSPSGIPSLSSKPSALPKKPVKQERGDKDEHTEPDSSETAKSVNDITDVHSSDEVESESVRPSRPSKPPRVQKQKSAESKIPKQGKSLLPVVHKSLDGGSPSGAGSGKAKSGIPMSKPPRPPQPTKSVPQHQENGSPSKKTLYQAVKGYTAQCEGELTFSEGTFIKELSDCDRPGWYVGMLADGTTGIYPADHLKPSPVSAQSEA